jgi:hypothetical protein
MNNTDKAGGFLEYQRLAPKRSRLFFRAGFNRPASLDVLIFLNLA